MWAHRQGVERARGVAQHAHAVDVDPRPRVCKITFTHYYFTIPLPLYSLLFYYTFTPLPLYPLVVTGVYSLLQNRVLLENTDLLITLYYNKMIYPITYYSPYPLLITHYYSKRFYFYFTLFIRFAMENR